MVLRKDELEVQLKDEHELIRDGVLRDDSPLDVSPEFSRLCDACRVGDLKGCQEAIASGVNINARDSFDYTPLILASLCGHYETVRLLLESGALCERDTFQGERCLYNALNNRIRNLLLQYDYSKSTDPLQPFAAHITSLLTREEPKTSDICLTASSSTWNLHKFILSARSPYFSQKLADSPETTLWKLANTIPPEAFQIALRYLYLGDVPSDLGLTPKSQVTEEEVFKGIDKVSKQLEIESLWEGILAGSDRRIARQRHQDEIARGRAQIETWYRENVLRHKIEIDSSKAQDVKWTRDNGIFADVLLRADEDTTSEDALSHGIETPKASTNNIPIGPTRSPSRSRQPPKKQSVLFPVHRAMLLRCDYFQTMFTSSFLEAQLTPHLQIIPVACTPSVLETVLDFLYTENCHIPIEEALDVLFAADMLFLEKLKTKAATVISTIGHGTMNLPHADVNNVERVGAAERDVEVDADVEVEKINVYDVIRAGWFLKIQRLEEFSARYLAYRLEQYIDEEEFEELIQESASRIEKRQETDSIELLDDIRYYLSERFRLRFEDSGLEEIMNESNETNDPTNPNPNTETDEVILTSTNVNVDINETDPFMNGEIKTLDGEIAGDEFAADAINYQILLGKIDGLLERLKLDA
ncbi:BTB/POZ domain-containing protein [Lachnellula hyalina]|uniref:BTB/POZ domain-containing protein n=1 Tax=Lachnellula hyalina TaxID=1316788 RepID=A0A8H8R4W3_9HELO|nr:BTB/POZ domain-containing protein [Lachnellula hyalina]TVY27540.1 BTB/POZ domain-containing protein [Lachnellula hyalina]